MRGETGKTVSDPMSLQDEASFIHSVNKPHTVPYSECVLTHSVTLPSAPQMADAVQNGSTSLGLGTAQLELNKET